MTDYVDLAASAYSLHPDQRRPPRWGSRLLPRTHPLTRVEDREQAEPASRQTRGIVRRIASAAMRALRTRSQSGSDI